MSQLIEAIGTLLYIAIFARIILSWFPQIRPNNPLVQLTWAVTEPILAPIRRDRVGARTLARPRFGS